MVVFKMRGCLDIDYEQIRDRSEMVEEGKEMIARAKELINYISNEQC